MEPAPVLAHLALIVRDLDAQGVLPVAALGLAPRDRTSVVAEDVDVVFVPVASADVELLQPRSAEGALARVLAGRGEGLHHIALWVPDLEAALTKAVHAGLRVAGPAPRRGAHGTRIAFLHPSSLHGVLVELVERR